MANTIRSVVGRLPVLFLGLIFLSAPLEAKPGQWRSLLSPHFEIFYEASWAPSGIVVELEKIHSTMRLDMSMLAPWMASERVKIYLHKNRESYLAGEFRPPEWSRGLARWKKKMIIIYDEGDRQKLRSVIAHELTHLFVESFFADNGKEVPVWLNEGLAVKMENDTLDTKSNTWDGALENMTPDRIIEFSSFFKSYPGAKLSPRQATDWYLQAFGIVKFLFRPSYKIQFKNLCYSLRNGVNLEQALWNIYRYKTFADLEKAWKKWAFNQSSAASGRKDEMVTPPQFSPVNFVPFKTK